MAALIDSCITSPSLPVVDHVALARHGHRLDGEQFATDLGPGEPGDLADLVRLLGHADLVATHAEDTCRDAVAACTATCLSAFSQQQRP
jgi:hypothetical protein